MTPLKNISDQDIPNRQEILNVLNLEITHIQDEYRRPGWTLWALLGGLATTIWLFLDEIEKTKIDFQNGLFAFLTITIVLDGLILLKFLISSEPNNIKAGVFKFYTDLFKVRHIVLLFLIRTALIFYVGFVYQSWVSYLSVTLLFTYYGVGVLFFLLFLALSFTRYPIILFGLSGTKCPATWLINVIRIFIVISVIVLAYGYLDVCVNNPSFIRAPEYRFGGLLWTVGFIFFKLGRDISQPVLLDSLVELRRDLLLDRIDSSSAKRQLDIILDGLEISDLLLQEDIKELLRLYEEANQEFKIAYERIKVAESHFSEALAKEPSGDNIQLIYVAILEGMLHADEVKIKLTELNENITRFSKRINLLITIYPQLRETLKLSIEEKIKNACDSVKKDYDEFIQKVTLFQNRLTDYIKENERKV